MSGIEQEIQDLSAESRRVRQVAAHELAQLAETNPEDLVPYMEQLVDGLSRPEAQTRWELFHVLSAIVKYKPEACSSGIEEAEASMLDEESPKLRLEAYRFLAAYGATSPSASDKVWPLLEATLQCYHGSPEFREMLQATVEFCQGKLSKKTKNAVLARAEFDAEKSATPFIKQYAKKIIHALHGTKRM